MLNLVNTFSRCTLPYMLVFVSKKVVLIWLLKMNRLPDAKIETLIDVLFDILNTVCIYK